MIRKAGEYRTELRENMRGGNGTVKIEHYWEAEKEMVAHNRMAAQLTLPPGGSIGFHNHENEDEHGKYGKGWRCCNGSWCCGGGCSRCCEQQKHKIKNEKACKENR